MDGEANVRSVPSQSHEILAEAGARRFLVPLLLEEFERFPDLVVEGCGGHLVLFRPRKILEPAAFPRFQHEMRTLARLFPGEMQIP
jgi:hypothetical protein